LLELIQIRGTLSGGLSINGWTFYPISAGHADVSADYTGAIAIALRNEKFLEIHDRQSISQHAVINVGLDFFIVQ
jgi:hypothetical protein